MTDRLDEIEARWRATKPSPWTKVRSGPDGVRTELRHRGGGLVCERLDEADAEALAHAPDDVAWLLREVRQLRRQLFDLRGDEGTMGKSRQGEITLATFKIESPDEDD
jgi:hypothetical protein